MLHLSPSILGVKFSTLCKCHGGTWKEPCVVCREDIRVGQMCRRLPCLHLFSPRMHRPVDCCQGRFIECCQRWELRSAKTFQKSMSHNYWKGSHPHKPHIRPYPRGGDLLGGRAHLPVGQFEAGRDAFPAAFPGSGGGASAQASPKPVGQIAGYWEIASIEIG